MISHKEIYEQLNQEFNITHSEEVVSSFWKGFRYFISYPLISKARILIPQFAVFEIPKVKIEKYLIRFNSRTYQREGFKQKSQEFYNQLLNLINERQEKGTGEYE